MIGKSISHYEITEKLGEGGMGVVYKARDTRLDRFVALKFLQPNPGEEAQDRQRFINEAKAASALDHSNICSIYEIGKSGDGRMFIAMAYYEGETLAAKIKRGPLPVKDAVEIAMEVAKGLSRAHEEDIIHRDIKPANIIITRRDEVKIVDFGLAKLSEGSKLTKVGTTVGTARYMSPEQTQGEAVDMRSDIFSLGVVLYEMLTGQPPFKGAYDLAVIYSILNLDPEPVTRLREDLPPGLEQAVTKCLAKDPAGRYQEADELIADLRRIQDPSAPGEAPSRLPGLKRASKTGFRSFVLPAILLGLLALTIGGYYMFYQPEAPPAERIPIAVVDFANETDETELNGLSGMLITALEQSRRLSVLTRSRMFEILKRMGKEDVDYIDETLGIEICKQAGVEALVIASVRKLGGRYAIDLKVLDPHQDQYLFTAKEEDDGQENIFAMIDRISEKTRRGLNEQAAEIRKTSQKVAEVTTLNLEAYQHFFKGEALIGKLKLTEAREEFKKAIALDSTFALAHYRLAYTFSWFGNPEAKEARRKAFQYIDRLPEKERLLMLTRKVGSLEEYIAKKKEFLKLYPYHKDGLFGVGDVLFHAKADYTTAIQYFSQLLEVDPEDGRALEHLVWIYQELEQYDKALEYAKLFVARVGTELAYEKLATTYTVLTDSGRAFQTYERALDLYPESSMPAVGSAHVYIHYNDYQKAAAQFRKLLAGGQPLSHKRDGYSGLALLHIYRGKYREAFKLMDDIIAIDEEAADSSNYFRDQVRKAFWLAAGLKDHENAKQAIHAGLTSGKTVNMLSYIPLFHTYTIIGEVDKASEAKKQFDKSLWPFVNNAANGYVKQARGEYEAAVKEFEIVTQKGFGWTKVLMAYELARCYVETEQYDKAIAAIKRIQRQNYYSFSAADYGAVVYPKSFHLLGKIYERMGETRLALENYKALLNLWKDADENLPELIDAKQRLSALQGMASQSFPSQSPAMPTAHTRALHGSDSQVVRSSRSVM